MPVPWDQMHFDDRVPIYLQIMQSIKGGILSGELRGDARIPSIRELSQKLRVNPNTVHRAYQELEREGFIHSKRGMGYFVTEDKASADTARLEAAREAALECIRRLLTMGLEPDEIMEVIGACLKEATK